MIALATSILFGTLALQQPEQRQGVTVPLDRAVEETLNNARELLEEGNTEAAVSLLQEVMEASPATLVSDQQESLRGAVVVARELIDQLDSEGRKLREQLVARVARDELARALQPPDEAALHGIAARYYGTEVGTLAAQALHDLARDRGISATDSSLRASLELPVVESLDDPSLPLVESRGLRPIWSFDFANSILGRHAYGHRLTLHEGVGFMTNGVEVAALRLGDGSVLWNFEGPPGWSSLRQGDYEDFSDSTSSDTVFAPVVADGILLVVLQEPFGVGRRDEFNRNRRWRSIDVRRMLPARRLYAFDAETGKLLWRTEPSWLLQRGGEPRELVAAPPAVDGGRIYLPVYDAVGTIDLSLEARNLYTGEKLWKTFLVSGQQETNLFGNILSELASQPPLARDGKVWFSSNLGTIVCLEGDSGHTVWSRQYVRSDLRVWQNGMESERIDTFANGPLGFDGKRLLCLPTDSEWAFLLDAASGRELQSWAFYDRSYGMLRSATGMSPRGAWFHGTSMSFLAFPGSGKRNLVSNPLYTSHGTPANRHPAALARGEILAPGVGSVEVLDPQSLRRTTLVQGLGSGNSDLGPVQVAPGLAFVMRNGGVTAFSSPDAILNSLARSGWDPATVQKLIPYLEGVDLREPRLAARVGARAETLADEAPDQELRERLLLIATRARLIAGEGAESLSLLEDVLATAQDERLVRAAELGLDVLERTDPTHPSMDRVLSILEQDPNRRVHRVDGRTERKDLALARARVFQSGKRDFGSDAHLDSLLRLLTLDGLEHERQGSLSLAEWARHQLQTILGNPRLAARVEQRAATAFATEPTSESLMRRFAGTQTAWEWLRQRAQSAHQDRAASLQIASWLRLYHWPQAEDQIEDLLDLNLIVGDVKRGALPADLQPLTSIDLGISRLLDFDLFGDRMLVLAQTELDGLLISLDASGRRESVPFRLADTPSLLPNDLRNRSFVHADGATLLLNRRWVSIQISDAKRTEFELPGRVTQAHRFGKLLAYLCSRQDGGIELEVRDLATGTRLLSAPLPLRDDRFHSIEWTGRDLLVLQDQTARAFRVPLFEQGDVEVVPLIVGPSTHDLDRLIATAERLVLPYIKQKDKLLWLLRGEQEEAKLLRNRFELRTFRTKTGFGWLQVPMSPDPRSSDGPVLYWEGLEEARGRELGFGTAEIRFPQFESFSAEREDLDADRLLTVRPTAEGGCLVQAWRLPREGAPLESWQLVLDDIPYNRLVGRLPKPVAHDSGWLIPLKLLNSRTDPSQLALLMVSHSGKLEGRLDLDSTRNSSYQVQPVLGDGFAGIRNESRLYLLGR